MYLSLIHIYLPDFAPTKQALDVMEAEFGYPGMARIMVKDVSLQEAKRIREEISAVDGVDLVLGSDVSTDVYMGAPFLNESMTEFIGVDLLAIDDYYKDGNALMDIVFEDKDGEPRTNAAIEEIYRIVGKDRGCFAGKMCIRDRYYRRAMWRPDTTPHWPTVDSFR